MACVAGILVVMTCLLICYNPRDDLGKELIKAGVLTEAEIEYIKRKKAQKRLTRESMRDDINVIAAALNRRKSRRSDKDYPALDL